MQNKLKIVGIQADLVWENATENIAFLETQIHSFPADIDLIVLPEMFTTGFTMNATKVAEKMNGISVTWMQKIAQQKQLAIVGSLVIVDEEKYYNRLVFVHPSGDIETYNKRHSFSLAGENNVYTSGTEKLIITYKGWKICPLICYDLRFPVWARNTQNYDLLIYIANWPVNRIHAWIALLKARAIENMSYVIGVNRTGKDANNYHYSGNSLTLDFLGEEIAHLPKNKVGIITATLDKNEQQKTREKLGFLNDKDDFKIEF
ncbi:amidohydrolase [Polaribacter sp.]|uniref:amidohydrolase n=1 Tax=Polaribacter sp. TaxID=1920175 RepID=UPI003EF51349